MRALEQLRIPVDVAGGTSMGAFVSALVACGFDSLEMTHIARETFVRSNLLNDYAIPKASMVPTYELSRTVTPSPVNPMGVKGAGEAGTIASTPAVVNALVDALSHLGVKHLDMPVTPERIWRALQTT